MTLDSPTLFIVGTIICGLSAVLQRVVATRLRESALRLWAVSNLVISVGCLLHALRGIIPLPLSVIGGNGLLILGAWLIAAGLDRFQGNRPKWAELAVLLSLSVAALSVSVYRGPGPGELAAIVSLACSYCLIRAAISLLRLSHQRTAATSTTCALLMLGFTAVYLLRSFGAYIGLIDANHPLLAGIIRIIALALAATWTVCSFVLSLDRQASVDELTGMLNRRAFLAGSRRLLRSANVNRQPLSILMIDLDHFKQVNDRFGHHVGDAALQACAVIIQQTIRSSDLSGRLGGEEFCVVLPDSDVRQAREAAERLRARCASGMLHIAQQPVNVTTSIGIASRDEHTRDLSSLMRHADNALYAAKALGRDHVVHYADLAAQQATEARTTRSSASVN